MQSHILKNPISSNIALQSLRSYTTGKPSIPLNNLAQIVILPITNPSSPSSPSPAASSPAASSPASVASDHNPQKLYIHFKYNEQLLNSSSSIIRYESLLTTKASKAWKSLSESDKPINKKIFNFVMKLMETIPWTENSMLTFPSQSALLKQVTTIATENSTNKDDITPALKSIHDLKINDSKILQIPTYHPSDLLIPTSPNDLKNQLLSIAKTNEAHFNKRMLINSLIIPFTLPVALVPVIPNVPGFYIAYRIYCNYKAMLGARHLAEMIKNDELKFIKSEVLDSIYQDHTTLDQKILINETLIDDLVNSPFELEEAKSGLIKALHQETKRQAFDK